MVEKRVTIEQEIDSLNKDIKSIAKKMGNDFKKQGLRCPKCHSPIEVGTLFIDNVNIEPIKVGCRKCGYYVLDKKTTLLAIEEVKLAYAGNRKIRRGIISYLKNRMI